MAFSKIVNLIETRSQLGKGTNDDPLREIVELFQFDGTRVAAIDPQIRGLIRDAYNAEDDAEQRRIVQRLYDLAGSNFRE